MFRNGHLATVMGNFWPRPKPDPQFPTQDRLFSVETGAGPSLEVLVQTQRPAHAKAEVILAHGLEGSSESGYMRSMASALVAAGYAVHRYNLRGCGPETSSLKPAWHRASNYHSGQTGDIRLLTQERKRASGLPVFLVGFSLGGNVVLKLAGELGERGGEMLAGVCSVCAPIDLAASVRKTAEPQNKLYQRRFVSRLKERVRLRHPIAPDLFPLEHLPDVHSIWDFDDYYTARIFGFGTAANYYETQSSNQFLGSIRVPTLTICAQDDPMIPAVIYEHPAFSSNPYLQRLKADHGGHLGFLARGSRRFWLDQVVEEWLDAIVGT
jgi:predicted alpha/beta-fold hydrolase